MSKIRKRKNQTPGLQDLVRAFDARHWKHAPGVASLIHSYLTLMPELGRALRPEHRDSLQEEKRFGLAGCVLEHAARFANNLGLVLELSGEPASLFICHRGMNIYHSRISHLPEACLHMGGRVEEWVIRDLAAFGTVLKELDHTPTSRLLLRSLSARIHRLFHYEEVTIPISTLVIFAHHLYPNDKYSSGSIDDSLELTPGDQINDFLSPLRTRLYELAEKHQLGQTLS